MDPHIATKTLYDYLQVTDYEFINLDKKNTCIVVERRPDPEDEAINEMAFWEGRYSLKDALDTLRVKVQMHPNRGKIRLQRALYLMHDGRVYSNNEGVEEPHILVHIRGGI